ncbi:LamG-like jellyroll fold domain-containing protein [Hydrogenimonas sp.]
MRKIALVLTLFSLFAGAYAAVPLAEYRMDECGWSGAAGEVRDSSGGGYDGTAKNGATTQNATLAGGGVCRVGDFTGAYLQLQTLPTLGTDWTMTTWIRFPLAPSANQFTLNGYEYYIVATVDGTGDLGFFAKSGSDYKWGVYDNRGRIREIAVGQIADGWHHVAQVATRRRTYLYIDGSYIGNVRTYTRGDLLYIGSSTDSTDDETIGAPMDEFKLFGSALSASEISTIHQNEVAGRNYDGTPRECFAYTGALTPLEFEGGEVTLKDTYADPTWTHVSFSTPFSSVPRVFMVIDSVGSHPASVRIRNVSRTGFDATLAEPEGEDGPHLSQTLSYFAINEGVHRLGDHYIEVGSLQTRKIQGKYASGDIGWERVTPSIALCEAAVVANIQTLNNETGNLPSQPSTPWMTTAIESNSSGIYLALERSETAAGTLASDETIAYMIAPANFTDTFFDDNNRSIAYETILTDPYFVGWDNGCRSVSFRNGYAAPPLIAGSKTSRYGVDGGWFRRCQLDASQVGFLVDEDRASDTERGHVPEVGAIFVFSDPFRVGGSGGSFVEGVFNAVDHTAVCSASLDWDDNLTTKRAGEEYRLSILAKEAGSGLPMEANITRVDLHYFAGGDTQQCSGTPYRSVTVCSGGCGVTDPAGCMPLTVPASLNDRAAVCVQVHIEGKDINATAVVDVNESNSSDDYAVRPDRFVFLQPPAEANLTAEHPYLFTGGANAVLTDGTTAVTDYNTTVALQYRTFMRNGEVNGSLAGTFLSSPSLFSSGVADLNFSFSDVANLTLELNDTAWSAVDADDTPLPERTVYGERNVTFIPDRFEVLFLSTPLLEDNDTAQRFTYLSNDLNMSAWARRLTVVVTAKGENNGTLLNFSDPMDRLFADPVDITPLLELPPRHSSAKTVGAPQPQSGADIDFSLGQGVVAYGDVPFNYDRRFDAPVDPFFVPGSEGNVSVAVADSRYPAVTGSAFSTFEGNATFYYGRMRAGDIRTTDPSTSNAIEIEVYDESASPLVAGFLQNSLRWFRNRKHRSGSPGRIREANATEGTALDTPADGSISLAYGTFGEGLLTMEINSSLDLSRSRTIHLNVDPWLWYAPKGFGSAYDYGAASDCASHPCFLYTYEAKGGGSGGVLSGDFNGSDFDAESLDANATYERREGVKLFR